MNHDQFEEQRTAIVKEYYDKYQGLSASFRDHVLSQDEFDAKIEALSDEREEKIMTIGEKKK